MAGRGFKGGRKISWIMDNFTESQLTEIKDFWGVDQTRAIEISIEFLQRDIAARKARGETSGKVSG